MRNSLIALTTAAALALAVPSGAGAIDPKQPFAVKTGTAKTAGTAVARGTVQFTSTSQVSIHGLIDDVCPGDYYGARLRIITFYKDGPATEGVAVDYRGCSLKPTELSYLSPYYPGRQIVRVKFILEEYKRENATVADRASANVRRR